MYIYTYTYIWDLTVLFFFWSSFDYEFFCMLKIFKNKFLAIIKQSIKLLNLLYLVFFVIDYFFPVMAYYYYN